MSVAQMSLFAALLALLAAGITIVVVVLMTTSGGRARLANSGPAIRQLALSVAAVATAGSLWFSEVGDFVPCEYCWYQRILMYPLVVVLGVEAWRPGMGSLRGAGRRLRWQPVRRPSPRVSAAARLRLRRASSARLRQLRPAARTVPTARLSGRVWSAARPAVPAAAARVRAERAAAAAAALKVLTFCGY